MRETPNLRIPGPTPVPADVLEAVARPMVDHRGREFAALIQRVAERLKEFYLTKEDVLLLSASGTGGLEAAVVNTLCWPSASAPSATGSRRSPRRSAPR